MEVVSVNGSYTLTNAAAQLRPRLIHGQEDISGGGNNQTEGASAPSDEAARRMKREILCLQQQMTFLKKVMRLHGKPGE